MKRKNKLIALVVMLVLMMQMTGCGGAAASGSENVINTWAGYEADAANGLRVKSVEFRTSDLENVSKVEYDVEGNITSSSIYHYAYEPFFEKIWGISAPFEYDFDEMYFGYEYYHYYNVWGISTSPLLKRGYFFLKKMSVQAYNDFSIATLKEADGERYVLVINFDYDDKYVTISETDSFYFSADGRVVQKTLEKKEDYSDANKTDVRYGKTGVTYNYDNIGRMTGYTENYVYEKEYKGDVSTGRSVINVRYTYVEDSLYLASLVCDSGNDNFWKKTYEYDYDDNHNIVRVKEYVFTDKMQINGTLQRVLECEYDENGNVVCMTEVEGSDQGNIMTRYQYDNDGDVFDWNLIEVCKYETFGSEEYVTSKIEYQYDSDNNGLIEKKTEYKYEANADYSIVNLIDTVEEARFLPNALEYKHEAQYSDEERGNFHEGCDEVYNCWTVTYYTQEEIDQYMHDQEFQRIN